MRRDPRPQSYSSHRSQKYSAGLRSEGERGREGEKTKGERPVAGRLCERERRSASRRLAAAQAAAGSGRNDLLPPLELVDIRLDDLKLSQRRLRKRDPAHIREVANSIARLGYSKPILIGPDNEVIDGETVIEGVRLLGLDRLSCIRVAHLNDSERRLVRLAINRLAEKGEWDFEALRFEFNELILVDAPIEIGGFAADEIDQILSLDPDDGVERASLAPEAGVEPVARLADLYQLGPHYLACGDATDAAILCRLMSEGAKPRLGRRAVSGVGNRSLVRMVLTDEHYNVPIAGNVTGRRHREFAMATGEMSAPEYLAFNETWMGAALPYLANGGLLATFIDWRGYSIVDAAAVNLGLAPVNLVVSSKTNAGMGSLYRSQHELLPLFSPSSGCRNTPPNSTKSSRSGAISRPITSPTRPSQTSPRSTTPSMTPSSISTASASQIRWPCHESLP